LIRIFFRFLTPKDDENKLNEDSGKLLEEHPNIVVVTGVIEANSVAKKIKGYPGIPMVMIGVTSPVDSCERREGLGDTCQALIFPK